MTIQHVITCDRCGVSSPKESLEESAVATARTSGWFVADDEAGPDLCQSCREVPS